jgi:hypothetical protein
MLAKLKPLLDTASVQVQLAHVTTYLRKSIPDDEWIPRIASEGWIVITADRGNVGRRKTGRKLPELCVEFKVTHVLVSPRIGQMSGFDKARHIVNTWPQMLALADAPRGSRFRMRMNNKGTAAVIERWETPRNSDTAAPDPIPESMFEDGTTATPEKPGRER